MTKNESQIEPNFLKLNKINLILVIVFITTFFLNK